MKKLWLAVTNEKEAFTFKWMVEVNLNKWFKFVKLANGSIGFTQVKEKKLK